MRKLFVVCAAALVLGFVAAPAVADEIEKGSKELTLEFAYTDTDDWGTEISLDVSLGYMLTEVHEVGGIVDWTNTDPDAGDSQSGGTIGGFYRYNLGIDADMLVPYAGAKAVLALGDFSDYYDFGAGVELGTRVMPSEHASINVELFYEKLFGTDIFDDKDSFGLAAGISIFF